MKQRLSLIVLLMLVLLLSTSVISAQDTENAEPVLEITGVNPTELPTVIITANVYDLLGQPVGGLTIDDFTLSGDLEGIAQVISVEHVTDDDLPIAAVLVIDISSSMAGTPIEQAQQAAREFVNALGPDDQIALMAFNHRIWEIQDYTSDKDVLIRAIDSLLYGGRTALYEAGLQAVNKGAASPTPRRAVVLLSDGAEYGAASIALREDALHQARIRGVPVYTIGLGYGTDRTYLQSLSGGSNARNYESPSPEELPQIYTELAGLLRTQYVVTITADVPLDGTEYGVTLQAQTPEGPTNTASFTVRAPIPVPLVSAPELTGEPISEPTTITVDVVADDTLVESETNILNAAGEGVTIATADGAANDIFIDPVEFAPGPYTVTHTVRDVDGDSGSVSFDIEIAALPSEISIEPDLTGLTIVEPTTITIGASGQTGVTSGSVALAGTSAEFDAVPFEFTIDPQALTPGDQIMSVAVTNAGGVTSTSDVALIIETFGPEVEISGFEGGETFSGSFMPGENTSVTVIVPGSQTPVTGVTFQVDGGESVTVDAEPYTYTLPDFIDLGSGPHTLNVTAANEGGGMTEVSLDFSVDVIATPTPIPTATIDLQATKDAQATTDAGQAAIIATQTADVQALIDAQATVEAATTMEAAATSDAAATADADATVDADATSDAEATADADATSDAEATEAQERIDFQATVDTVASAEAREGMNAQATADAAATEDDAATMDAQASEDAAATENAAATTNAEGTADAVATRDAAATMDAAATEQAMNPTTEAEATAERQALDAQATSDAQATTDAAATEEAGATAVSQAADAQATTDAQATADAAVTEVAEPTDEPDVTDEGPVASPEPTGELTEVEASGAQEEGISTPIIISILVLIVLLLYFLWWRRRGK